MRIWDGERLRDVMETVKEISGGTDRKAARALGITQSTFTRLRTDTDRRFIQAKTFRKIRRGLRDLEPAPEVVDEARAKGNEPLPFGLLGLLASSVIQGEGELALREFQSWMGRERRRLESIGAAAVFRELYDQPRYQQHFDRLLRRCARPILPESDDHRSWIALYRMVEPLAMASQTGGVEYGWRELEGKEQEGLHFYLKAAEQCQRALLGRESALQRAGHEQFRASEEYKAWLAGFDEPDAEEGREPPGFWDDIP